MRLFLLAMTLAVCVVNADDKINGKKGNGKKGTNQAVLATDATLVAELRKAYEVLDKADPIYHGHRAKARHEINQAIGQLQQEMHKKGLKEHPHKDNTKLPTALSHAQVKESIREVEVILQQLKSLPPTTHRSRAQGHLVTAVQEMNKGLTTVKPKK
ncbi:MAG: hypothetical protein EBV06_16680 [Planctomycetia bacterium]|nr:hypothetical protein [Planctomycetia bacterium]